MDELSRERKRIDALDKKIVSLLEQRFLVVKRIRAYKRKASVPIEDKVRERAIVRRFHSSSLPKRFIKAFFGLLFEEAKR